MLAAIQIIIEIQKNNVIAYGLTDIFDSCVWICFIFLHSDTFQSLVKYRSKMSAVRTFKTAEWNNHMLLSVLHLYR